MTVKELCELLAPETNGHLPVAVRCRWQGDAPADPVFDVMYAVEELEPDTGEDVIVIECQQG